MGSWWRFLLGGQKKVALRRGFTVLSKPVVYMYREWKFAVFRWTTSLYKNFHWKHVDSSFQRYQSPVRLFQLSSRDICEQSSITVRSYGLIEGRKSRRQWDVEELTDAIFQCDLTMVCWVSDTQEDWSAWKLARILWSCVKFQPRINGGVFNTSVIEFSCNTKKII